VAQTASAATAPSRQPVCQAGAPPGALQPPPHNRPLPRRATPDQRRRPQRRRPSGTPKARTRAPRTRRARLRRRARPRFRPAQSLSPGVNSRPVKVAPGRPGTVQPGVRDSSRPPTRTVRGHSPLCSTSADRLRSSSDDSVAMGVRTATTEEAEATAQQLTLRREDFSVRPSFGCRLQQPFECRLQQAWRSSDDIASFAEPGLRGPGR